MKRLIILSALATLAVGSSFAMAMPGHGGPKAHFAELDANNDGKVTREEFQTGKLARFQRADQNKDGFVTAAELAAARKAEHGKRIDELFKNSDKDADGRLSKAEATDMHEKKFAHLDANSDGFIGKDEAKQVEPPKHGGAKGAGWFGKLDTNADGKLSRSELDQGGELFDRLDRDDDGVLSVGEMKMKGHGRGEKHRGKPGHEGRKHPKKG
jgi:Ca2+-binding EF-hand superfamily protein